MRVLIFINVQAKVPTELHTREESGEGYCTFIFSSVKARKQINVNQHVNPVC